MITSEVRVSFEKPIIFEFIIHNYLNKSSQWNSVAQWTFRFDNPFCVKFVSLADKCDQSFCDKKRMKFVYRLLYLTKLNASVRLESILMSSFMLFVMPNDQCAKWWVSKRLLILMNRPTVNMPDHFERHHVCRRCHLFVHFDFQFRFGFPTHFSIESRISCRQPFKNCDYCGWSETETGAKWMEMWVCTRERCKIEKQNSAFFSLF